MRNIDEIKNMNVKQLAEFLSGNFMHMASIAICNKTCRHWKNNACGLHDEGINCPVTDEEMLIHWLMQNKC